jgi:hypothetical protein
MNGLLWISFVVCSLLSIILATYGYTLEHHFAFMWVLFWICIVLSTLIVFRGRFRFWKLAVVAVILILGQFAALEFLVVITIWKLRGGMV